MNWWHSPEEVVSEGAQQLEPKAEEGQGVYPTWREELAQELRCGNAACVERTVWCG